MSTNELDAYQTIFTVLGASFLAMSYLTWADRDRWDEDRARWRRPTVWLTGQAALNFQIAMGVINLGVAVAVL